MMMASQNSHYSHTDGLDEEYRRAISHDYGQARLPQG